MYYSNRWQPYLDYLVQIGDGYRFARNMSHTVTPVIPALVPLTIREEWASELMGLSLRKIFLSYSFDNKKEVYSDF